MKKHFHLLEVVLVTCLLLIAGPVAAQTFFVGSSSYMPLTVTVAPSGAVTVASATLYTAMDDYSGRVIVNLGYGMKCSDGIEDATFTVTESLNGAYELTNELLKIVKGSNHFKGMKAYVWNVNAPIARVSSLVAACKASPKPVHLAILTVKYTCAGKKNMFVNGTADYDLICQKPPPPPPPPPPPVTSLPVPVFVPLPAVPLRQQACRSSISCLQGSTCVNGLCQPAP